MKRIHRFATYALALFLIVTPVQAQRRRAAPKPSIDPSTPAGWLLANAAQLASVDPSPYRYDLEPLRAMVGDATTVGLGDGTHGTHEFFTVKLRIVDFLVREMGFETVAFEASFPAFRELNAYVLGGPGNPRDILGSIHSLYPYWDSEEIVALAEWMRDYNDHRGSKPPVQIVGFDISDQVRAAADLVSYLASVDPAFSSDAAAAYGCLPNDQVTDELPPACFSAVGQIRTRLAASRDAFVSRSSQHDYDEALQNATVIVDRYASGHLFELRDKNMAKNAQWVKHHYGTTERLILWAHQEHLGKTQINRGWDSMGILLANALAADYFVIGTCTFRGTFLLWSGDPTALQERTATFRAAGAEYYETLLHAAAAPRLLIPLRGAVPDWLAGPREFRYAGVQSGSRDDFVKSESLPQKLDAIVYIEETTPVRTLRR